MSAARSTALQTFGFPHDTASKRRSKTCVSLGPYNTQGHLHNLVAAVLIAVGASDEKRQRASRVLVIRIPAHLYGAQLVLQVPTSRLGELVARASKRFTRRMRFGDKVEAVYDEVESDKGETWQTSGDSDPLLLDSVEGRFGLHDELVEA